MPVSFRRNVQIPDILVLHKCPLKSSEWQTIAGYRVTTPTRTLFDMLCSDISKAFISQIVKEGTSRGLFPKQKLKKYRLLETIGRFE